VSIPVLKFDAVIVGAGGAGLRSAIQLSEAGLKTAVLVQGFPDPFAHRCGAGWRGCFARQFRGGSLALAHVRYRQGFRLARRPGRDRVHVQKGQRSGRRARALRHAFSTVPTNGKIYQRPFGGHMSNFGEKPVRRSCAAADRTGHAMLHAMYQRNVKANTQFFVEWMALDLIRDEEGHVLGVTAMEMETGQIVILPRSCHHFRDRRCRSYLLLFDQCLHQYR
jgi:succinate dehydrogenase / fumarate reductase flavoprotein subunit